MTTSGDVGPGSLSRPTRRLLALETGIAPGNLWVPSSESDHRRVLAVLTYLQEEHPGADA